MTDLLERIRQTLNEHGTTALALEPGEIELVEFADGVASVRLSVACASCPANLPRLIAEIEEELRRRVPEVEILEVVP